MLIKESVPKFVKEEVMENSIVGKKNILLPSDRDGYMHLYLYDMNGKLIRQVEKGNYDVTAIYGMDEKTGDVYFQAAKLNAHDRQVYVAHKNGKVERLTDAEGSNSAILLRRLPLFREHLEQLTAILMSSPYAATRVR